MRKRKSDIWDMLARVSPPEVKPFINQLRAVDLPPGYMRRAGEFQEKQLAMLRRKSYRELVKLPEKAELQAPSGLSKLRFFVVRKRRKKQGIEIFVEASYWVEGKMVFARSPSFEMLPNGVLRRPFEHDPED